MVREALKLGQRGRWARDDVIAILETHGIKLKPVGPDAGWLEKIEFAQTLNEAWRQRTAAGVLDQVAREFVNRPVDAETKRSLHTARGLAAKSLGDPQRAKEVLDRAIELLPAGIDS